MWINIVKKRYNFFLFVQINEFGVLAWLLRLEKSVFLNCIPIENEFHSLIYTGIFSDSQNFRRVISISLNSELVPDYLIVTLLPPAWGCFSFLIRSKYSDLLTSVLRVFNFFVRLQHFHLILF